MLSFRSKIFSRKRGFISLVLCCLLKEGNLARLLLAHDRKGASVGAKGTRVQPFPRSFYEGGYQGKEHVSGSHEVDFARSRIAELAPTPVHQDPGIVLPTDYRMVAGHE